MDENYSLADVFGNADYQGPDWDVGPQNNGTYNIPASAQPVNQQWDSGGGQVGNYGGQILGILQQGIGAWSQNKRNQDFLDYQRYEATAGGVYAQGRPNPVLVPQAQASVSAFGNPIVLLMMVGAAVLLLRGK
jgi:hypothetical protein